MPITYTEYDAEVMPNNLLAYVITVFGFYNTIDVDVEAIGRKASKIYDDIPFCRPLLNQLFLEKFFSAVPNLVSNNLRLPP